MQYIDYIQKNCSTLVLISSESCNLQCSYCEIAKHINASKHLSEALKTKESFINGQYLKTINHTFDRLHMDKNKITRFELWGQEPTLTLNEVSSFFPSLYKEFPNISTIMFSTNGVSLMDSIITFIKILDDTIEHEFHIEIQFSYDGAYQTKHNRGIDGSVITNNISKVISNLNNIILKNGDITFSFHNVIDLPSITYCVNHPEAIHPYMEEFELLYNRYTSENTNPKVRFLEFGSSLTCPYNGTVQEGKDLVTFYQLCEEKCADLVMKNWRNLPFSIIQRSSEEGYQKARRLLIESNLLRQNLQWDDLATLSSNLSCGTNGLNLKIRYDGTFIHCQCALLGIKEEELEGKMDRDSIVQKRRLKAGFYPNIFTSSDKDLDKYFYMMSGQQTESFLNGYINTYELMRMLVAAGQIDQKYADPSELVKAAYYMTLTTSCPHNAIVNTLTSCCKDVGWIRLLGNGFLDLSLKVKEEENLYANERSRQYTNPDCN